MAPYKVIVIITFIVIVIIMVMMANYIIDITRNEAM